VRLAPRDTLAARHTRLRQAIVSSDLDGLVITHLPNVFYLTNVVGTAGIAVATRDRLYLILDFRYLTAAKAIWDTPYGCPDAEILPVERTYDETLVALTKRLRPRRFGIEGNNVPVNRLTQLTTRVGGATEIVATDGVVEKLRIIKDAHEIEMLRCGARLLSPVAADVLHDATAGISEQELAAKIDWRIKSAGFERCSFETIVASGPNAALPHAHAGERVLHDGDLVVLDFGGVYGGYCVDLTRTIAIGDPDAEMARVYNAVLEAQRAAISAVKPGVRAGDIDAAARLTLARHGLAEAFGHSTGHGLGVEIHETPRIGPRREPDGDASRDAGAAAAPAAADDAIEPGMVFTIEPGAYLPGWGGVRIEDDVLVTSDGVEVLTNVPTKLTHTHGI
jgi:Xaa-Pro aminopeptidase